MSIPLYAPNTGRVFQYWNPTSAIEVERAVERADDSLDVLEDLATRREALKRCAEALASRRDALATMVVTEVGKKPDEAQGEVDYAISFLRSARRAIDQLCFEDIIDDGRVIRNVPYGVALLIASFNDPLAGLTRKLGPALAAGAPAVVKPSRLGVMCAELLMEAFRDAGLDQFVRLVAPENNAVIEALIADPRIGVISFTGSTAAGRRLATAAAQHGKKAIVELGGNCPFVICEDADLSHAIDDLITRKLKAAGQACSSVNRVFVAASQYATFKERLAERVATLVVGPSDRPDVDLGPLRTRDATIDLCAAIGQALRTGETLWSEAPSPSPPNSPFVFPFTVVEAKGKSFFDSYESFGPVLSVRPFHSLDKLIERLERERHALVAYFYCAEPKRLAPRLGRLRFGSLGLNSTAIQGTDIPTGGFWDAGIGREGGRWGVCEFLAPINQRFGTS